MTAICKQEDFRNIPLPLSIRAKPTPDMFSTIGGFLHRTLKTIKHQYRLRRQQKIDRQAFLTMLNLDDHILKDIGISRDDLLWASKLPLSQNASCALNDIARGNSGGE